jgi:hypothetical protein
MPAVEKPKCDYSIRNASQVVLRDCRAGWGTKRPDYFSRALEAENVRGLALSRFQGEDVHPERDESGIVR